MKKILFLIIGVLIFALEIDVKSLEKSVSKHPDDLNSRLLIAKYYIKHNNYEKAQKYLNYILKKDPKNKIAKKMKNNLIAEYFIEKINKKYDNINNAVKTLYDQNKYKELIKLYNKLKSINKTSLLNEDSLVKIARVNMWEGNYKTSLSIISKLQNKKTLDYYEIKAYDLYYMGDYKNSKKYFQILYQTTGKNDYAEKLLDIYLYLNDINSAQKLLLSLKRTNPKLAKKYEKKIIKLKQQQLEALKIRYKKDPTFENMQALAYKYYEQSPNKAYDLIKQYIKQHPNNMKAKIFLAQLLSWNGDYNSALKYLQNFKDSKNMNAKLLFGKILAWQGEYDKALPFLSDVYDHGNKQQKYDAKKMIAYIALWKSENNKAKKIFTSLLKENPNDEDVKESLMVLNGQIKPLIEKYKKLLKKNPNNEEYILKLADYNYMIKNYASAANYYEKYLKKHPEKLEVYKTLGDIYLQLKNYYKGFGYLEYYANYKNTKEAYLDLANRYYWNGFNKEALKVIDDLLKKYPNFEDALILKAKLLKINPRFVNSSTSATIDEYYSKRSDKLLALGDRAYFANLYKTATEYYKEYLFLKPNDYDVREKYAYALENSKEYNKAAGEFYLLMWYKKTPMIEYHYAYNLQNAGKIKQAKKIYEELLKNVPRKAPDYIIKFLNNWKKAWESMDIKKYETFYDDKIKNNLYWRLKKQSLFQKSSFISVGIYDPVLISQENNISKVKFFQVYASKIKKDKGYKTLTLKCINKKCKIIKEEWAPGTYTPFNPNNSLEKYIKDNLNIIKKQQEIKFLPISSNNIYKKKLISHPKIKYKKKKDIVLSSDLKLEPQSQNEALDYLYLKKIKATKKNIFQQVLKDNSSPPYNWEVYADLDHFADNQKTKMLTYYFSISKRINYFFPFIFYKGYTLKVISSNKKGFLYGAGIKKKPFLFDAFFDNSGKKTIGWDFEYYPFSYRGMTLRLNKHNMVYSRKSICSSNHTKIKAEITQYKTIKNPRELWWSLAFEKVDDGNNVLTPQLEYDILSYSYKKTPFILYYSGWFQFNTKQTTCYYSPKKTDTNILGLKIIKPYKYISIKFKGGLGYSFFDKSYVYTLGLWGNSINIHNFDSKLGCELSNTTPIKKTSNYESYECELILRKRW